MTDSNAFDFTKFVPGFDFLKNLTPHAPATGTGAPGWVAPTLDPQEIDKRIQELKTVQFWLEQNAKGIAATIQAMEVQRMTLSTLQNMNVSFQDMAESLKVKPTASAAQQEEEKHPTKATAKDNKIDPAQWWGALTEQFQQIASHAMQDMTHHAATHATNAVPKNFAVKKTTASTKNSRTAGAVKRKAVAKSSTGTSKPKASR
jgi:hypothetical protein